MGIFGLEFRVIKLYANTHTHTHRIEYSVYPLYAATWRWGIRLGVMVKNLSNGYLPKRPKHFVNIN